MSDMAAGITGLAWIVTWFLAIWIYLLFDKNIGIALFFTGLFSLFLCMIQVSIEDEAKKAKNP